jgi:PAS domain S-box-containing protein
MSPSIDNEHPPIRDPRALTLGADCLTGHDRVIPSEPPLAADLDPHAQSELLRRQAELALLESQQRFARFMTHLPGLAWIKDEQGRYVYANDTALKAFRTCRDDLYGKLDEELFPPDVAEQFRENDRRALASESGIQTIETLEHEDGLVHHSIVSKFPIPGGDEQAALVGGMAVDITDASGASPTACTAGS